MNNQTQKYVERIIAAQGEDNFSEILEAEVNNAIMDERQGCFDLVDKFRSYETVNKPEYSTEAIAVKFTLKALAHNLCELIKARGGTPPPWENK